MDDLRVGHGVVIPAEELTFRFSRSGGPGGQNVNKRDTKVEVVFDLARSSALSDAMRRRAMSRLRTRLDARGRLHIVVSTERSQARNRERGLELLAETLERALRPPPKPRRATKPSRAATDRRIASKRTRGALKRQRGRPDDD